LTHLQDLFGRLRQAWLKLHPAKGLFAMRKKINYLGHTISEKGIEPDRSKVAVLRHVKAPTNQKELRSFFGAIGFFRRFVLHYSHKIAIFRPLLVKDAKWVWTPDHEKAFQDLKERLFQSSILRFPDFSKPTYLHTDASLRAISHCLMLREGGTTGLFYVISYRGRLLRKFECSWQISHLESLAVVSGVRHYHSYICMRKFYIVSDSMSLTFLKTLPLTADSKLARHALFLQQYQYEILHTKGSENC
jgi:hypothetical protein